MNTKRLKAILLMVLTLAPSLGMRGQTAREVLDKAAAIVGNKKGVEADFVIKGLQQASGTIQVKGKKFHAATAQAAIWFDGKTMWTYMKNSDEVNITHPSQKQLQVMNPYNFINIYKKGYMMEMTKEKGAYKIHLTATDSQQHIEEMYITVNTSNYHLKEVKMSHGRGQGKKGWNTYTITSLRQKSLVDSSFAFQSKDFPTAEVIDLR